MIAQLRGRLLEKGPNQVVVGVGGIGYQVFVPLSTYYQLPDPGQKVSLYTFTHLREDGLLLYGFKTLEERTLFDLLRGVSGVGPRLATTILSGISVEELVPALAEGDIPRLKAIPGIGRKTAERLVLELREKVGETSACKGGLPSGPAQFLGDIVSVLMNLGCSRKEATEAAEASKKALGTDADFEKLVKMAMKHLPGAK